LMAWLLWSVAHIYFLIGFRNRLAVAANWCWNYLTFQRGTRLITGITGSRIEDVMPVVPAAPKSLEIGDDSRHYRVAAREDAHAQHICFGGRRRAGAADRERARRSP